VIKRGIIIPPQVEGKDELEITRKGRGDGDETKRVKVRAATKKRGGMKVPLGTYSHQALTTGNQYLPC